MALIVNFSLVNLSQAPRFEKLPSHLLSKHRNLEERLSLRLDVGIDEDLLSHQLEEDGAGQGLDDGDVVVGVHLFHDVADVADGQTVEDVEQDDDDEEHEHGEDDVAEPVIELNLNKVNI